jgi:hypothetical protein
MKSITVLLLEAIIVGISLVIIALVINKLPELPTLVNNPMIDGIFYTGLIAHLLFEASGVNIWYSKNYCSLLK